METIYTHKITPKELELIGKEKFSKRDYLRFLGTDERLYDLAMLFWHRGDKKKAEHYSSMMSEQMQDDLWRIILHP